MTWSTVVKAAVAGVVVSAAASLFGRALLLAGLPLVAVQVSLVTGAAVAAAVVAGLAAANAVRADADLLRARAHGVIGVGTAGVVAGLVGFGDPSLAVGLGVGAGAAGWIGARVATDGPRRDDYGRPEDSSG